MKKESTIYNLIGIGIGPFNLGLAALLQPVKELSSIFFDGVSEFNWHPGLMLDSATLQNPFMGTDLVTMADPKSRFSFLNYLKENDRLYKFFIRENFFILRKEYNSYCKWVASQLDNCKFGQQVTSVSYDNGLYILKVKDVSTGQEKEYITRKLVLGTGTQPNIPDFVNRQSLPKVIHTSQYQFRKSEILDSASVSIIGSGQSAAEIFSDLLPGLQSGLKINWFTRSERYFPLEYSKLTLELTSPEYVDYFYHLPSEKRRQILSVQNNLYKGINFDLISSIFDKLYEMSVDNTELPVLLRTNCKLNVISPTRKGSNHLEFTEVHQQKNFTEESDYVILATGYKYNEPSCIEGIQSRIMRTPENLLDVSRNYTVDINKNEIFVQNAELHTHGFVSPDLGMGAYRNSIIINTIAGKEIYKVEKRIAFQEFGVPVNSEEKLPQGESVKNLAESL
ncbi:MAG: SidA/IucD/PvdA family monooxygenase [Sporocytophaga sp.]|nr:SidA/IucD/PvdA family monooxygenase [Sporocytophaga sp.]